MKYSRREEDAIYARTKAITLEQEHHRTHPMYGPPEPPDYLRSAVQEAGLASIGGYEGEFFNEDEFLKILAERGYKVVPS